MLCLFAWSQQTQQTRPPQKQTEQKQTDQKQDAQKQTEQEQLPPAISVTVNNVILPVTVTDDKGRFVTDLTQKDFRVLDEGRTQRITYFNHEKGQSTVIGFLVDTSASSMRHWSTYRDAIKEMIWGLLPEDKNYQGYLISYSSTAELLANTTWDPDKLTAQVDRIHPGGGAALFNAVHRACTDRALVPGEPYQPRRVIVIFGDGHDTASDYTLNQVIELAQRYQVTIYGVSTAAYGFDNPDRDQLERLANETGGHVEYPLVNPYSDVSGYLSQPSDEGNYALKVGTGGYAAAISSAIFKSVGALQGEITTQYILIYHPDIDPATAYKEKRKIKVEIPTLPAGSVKVQTRPYYYPYPVGGGPG